MKKIIIIILLIVLAWGIVIIPKVISIYSYYQPSKQYKTYPVKNSITNDTIRILFIGDSWAAYHHQYDSLLSHMITIQSGFSCNILSKGFVGAKSKEIYERMFNDYKDNLIEHPNYCIISAGINDAVAKLGVNYYIINYSFILRFLLDNNIIPVVLEMPTVDYKAVYNREKLTAKIRHHISSTLTGADFYSFVNYKQSLLNTIIHNNWEDSIIYIPSNEWISDNIISNRHYYREDGIHLNERGYLKLDSCLANKISTDLSLQKSLP